MPIDMDSHFFPREALRVAENFGFRLSRNEKGHELVYVPMADSFHRMYGPEYYDLDLRRSAMSEAGYDRQLLICDGGFAPDHVPLETSVNVFRAFNDTVSKIQKDHEEFIGIADVAHQDPLAAMPDCMITPPGLPIAADRHWGGNDAPRPGVPYP